MRLFPQVLCDSFLLLLKALGLNDDMPSETEDTVDATELGLDDAVKAKRSTKDKKAKKEEDKPSKKEKKSKKHKKSKKAKKAKKCKPEDDEDEEDEDVLSSVAAIETETASNGALATKRPKPAKDQEQV